MDRNLNIASGEHPTRLTGGTAVARALVDNGVTHMFGIHGYIDTVVEEACRLGVSNIHFRHEQSAGFAADAYGRITKKAGVCYASASGGMSNYLAPLSQGIGALSPIVLIVGQHGTAGDNLEVLQEGYAAECFKPVTKWTKRLTDWELNSYWTQKALRDSCTYPPGPICLEVPLNNQWRFGPEPQRKYIPAYEQPRVPASAGDPREVAKVAELLLSSKRPLIVAGDGVHWSGASDVLLAFATAMQIPVNTRRTARGAVSEADRIALPTPARGAMLADADVVVLVGMRAGELESWFEAPDWPRGKVKYVQINETPQELWHALPTQAMIVGSSKLVLEQLLDHCKTERRDSAHRQQWITRLHDLRAQVADRRAQALHQYERCTPIHTFELTHTLANVVDQDATIIYDSYSGSLYLTDAVQARFAGQVLDAGPRVALGQGIGMCIGAAMARPGKQLVTLVGDGGIGISGPEIETMVHHNIAGVIVVLNNSSWGGNSLMGGDIHPNIDWSVGLDNRWDKAFEALGAHAEFVQRSEDLAPAMRRALESGRPAVVNVVADCDGTEFSQAWLRLKSGDMWSRGLENIGSGIKQHFKVSPQDALRIRKSAEDNGTHIPIAFIAELTGHSEDLLREVAHKRGYDLGEIGTREPRSVQS